MRFVSRILFCIVLACCAFQSTHAQGFVGRDELTPEMVDVLKHPTSLFVYSLKAQETNVNPNYFGWKLLGKAPVNEQPDREKIGEMLVNVTSPKSVRYCHFQPHHGVSIFSNGGRVDYEICFHCRQILIYSDNGEYWNHGLLNNSMELEDFLNKVLAKHKVRQATEYVLEKNKSQSRNKSKQQLTK